MSECVKVTASYQLQFNNDESWHKLVWAETTAAIDFRPHRIGLTSASALCRQIGEVSDYLGLLLDEVDNCNINIPAFNSLSVLIKEEDDDIMEDLLWVRVRTIIDDLANKARATASQMGNRCPSSGALRQFEVFSKGGSGSVEVSA